MKTLTADNGAAAAEPGGPDFHWPAWCPHGDGYHTATTPDLADAQQRAEQMGSYGRQQEIQTLIHITRTGPGEFAAGPSPAGTSPASRPRSAPSRYPAGNPFYTAAAGLAAAAGTGLLLPAVISVTLGPLPADNATATRLCGLLAASFIIILTILATAQRITLNRRPPARDPGTPEAGPPDQAAGSRRRPETAAPGTRNDLVMSGTIPPGTLAAAHGEITTAGLRMRAAGPAVRASDRERDITIDQLADAYADGRIRHPQHESRVQAALTAQTRRDLAALTADLPADAARSSPGLKPRRRHQP